MVQACSYLFVPANRPDRFDKAWLSGAHRVIVDLEDAVPLAEKGAARSAVASWLSADKPVLLRLNAAGSEHWVHDCELIAKPGLAGLVLPKVQDAEVLSSLHLAQPGLALFPMIETARGLAHLPEICAAPGVSAILFGSLDFALDINAFGDQALLMARSEIVLQSRLAGIHMPVDGVTADFENLSYLERDARNARELGFGAKMCIHPRQIQAVNAAFAPTPQELEWARSVVRAADLAGGGAVAVEGKMVDRPVILRARHILEQ